MIQEDDVENLFFLKGNTLNEKRQSIKIFTKKNALLKTDKNYFIYPNSLNRNRLSEDEKRLLLLKGKINDIKELEEQVLINYGALIYKNGEDQYLIDNIFSYYKEVDYLMRNYDQIYVSLSDELKILKENTEFIYDFLASECPENLKEFLNKRGYKPLDCLNDLLDESETIFLLKDIYFMHNYVECGFDIALTKMATSYLYVDNKDFVLDLKNKIKSLSDNEFRINLHYLKECLVEQRNNSLKIIDKYFNSREEWIKELGILMKVIHAFREGIFKEHSMIRDYIFDWLEVNAKPQELINIEKINALFKKEITFYDENDLSLIRLPKSLFRMEEKILKLEKYIEAIENLSEENKHLLHIQEKIGKTIIFGIENLKGEEKESLIFDIDELMKQYQKMVEGKYGINKENEKFFEKKILSINKLREALIYVRQNKVET